MLLHFGKTFLHAWLFSTEDGYVYCAENETIRYNETAMHFRKVVNRPYADFSPIREPIIDISLVDCCCKRHHNRMCDHIAITAPGIWPFGEGIECDACYGQGSSLCESMKV